ncbi:MAG: hypothetical protein DI539_12910 [Flavobacterium psychrophilum]|nr:MAG: hypothetical protein DI539_12910 [Flavobacterium psychrophilum]
MKKTIYGLLLLSLAGVVSCEKESATQDTEATTKVDEKANTKNYAIAVETLNEQLFRKQYDMNTSVFSSGTTLNNYLFYGIGAYNYDMAVLEKTGTNSSTIYYESGIPGNNKYGPVKLDGADFLLDEIELIDDNIDKLFGLRGGRIYWLIYNGSNFDASLYYTYPGTPINIATRRFTIAPVANSNSFIRLYSASNVASQVGQPPAMTTLNYVDMNVDNGLITPFTSVSTQIPGTGNLSSFTAVDYFNTPPIAAKHYVVVDKDIYNLNTATTLSLTGSFANSVRDCSFYHR